MQDKALRRGTDLPGIVQPRVNADLHGFIQVGIVQHHEHVVPAQFQGRFFEVLRSLCRNHATRFF
ncbi:Uncharacterised protein [Enterobacter cloacae]|nr:Uncharacterised protein [Enterobacter cloacae]